MKNEFIPESLYRKILAVMPVPCADAVIVNRKAFLLGKRTREPDKGKWWLVGGRIVKGETREKAVVRKVREETGFSRVKVEKELWSSETMFKNSFQGPPSHTIGTVYLVSVPSRTVPRANEDFHDAFRWFTKIPPGLHPYVTESLRKAGFSMEKSGRKRRKTA